jgi:hypothetical protein
MKLHENYKDIPGWGMDADPENEPTYPMKHYTGDDHHRSDYPRSAPQAKDVEVLKSTERPKLSAVFGNTVPPSGLSGKIRRYAFTHSEDRYRHWLPLIFADRVNAVEGIISDIKKGYFPNMFKERGWKVEMKYNTKNFALKVATTAAVGIAVYLMLCGKKRK